MSKKLRMLVITVLFALSVVFSGSAIANMTSQQALAATVWSDFVIAEEILEGDTFQVPDRTVNVNGTEVVAKVVVTFPDGTTTDKDSFVLDLPGEYTLKYSATVNKRVYTKTETFVAKYRVVRTYNSATSIEYGSHALAPKINGLVVRLAEGDKLNFNEIIDISDNTTSNCLFEFFVTSDAPGAYDFEKMFIQLTDVSNPDNYFKVRLMRSSDGVKYPSTYAIAGGQGQPMSGWEGGAWNKLHVENQWGAQVRHSFYSTYDGGNTTNGVGDHKVGIYYDALTKSIYMNNTFVIDLDNPNYFSTLWEGFETNQVKLTVWAEEYASTHANFVITKAGDNFNLTEKTMQETTPPTITVNTEYAKDAMPAAEVGVQYSIPTATAFDEYAGACSVKTEVYYNYTNAANATFVDIKDGKFAVEYIGDYAIVYTARDYMGNEAQEIFWVNSVADLDAPVITLLGTIPAEMNAGELIALPEYTVSGGSGVSTVKIYANEGGEDIELANTFRPNVVSNSTVLKYVVTDYIGQTTVKEFTINVKGGSAPIFVDEPVYPKYMIAGASYVLPELYANDYTSGELVRKLATITTTDANGTNVVEAGASYTPVVANNFDTVKITYTVEDVEYVVERQAVLSKNEDGGVLVSNYFALNNATITPQDENSIIEAKAANAGWTFANSLVAQEMTVTLHANPAKSNFKGLKFTIVDSLNPEIEISATILKEGKTVRMVTDAASIDIEIGFASDSKSNQFILGYKDGFFTINNTNVAVRTTNNGEAFNGFPSQFVYTSVEFIDAAVGANYYLVEVNGQKVSNVTLDRIAPKIVVLGERGGTKKYNSTVTLPAALAGDVLDPSITFTVRVTDPNGDVVTSTDGINLNRVDPRREYDIVLNVHGQFKITYQAKDTYSNKTNTFSYVINVDDEVGPQMVFDHAFQSEVKLGDVIVIPNFTVEDNYCAVEEIVITKYCLTPTGFLIVLPEDSNAVRTNYVGTYEFRVIATDAAGNKTMCRMNVTVTE